MSQFDFKITTVSASKHKSCYPRYRINSGLKYVKLPLYLPHYKSPTALSHMHHLTCGINSLLHSVNLILFTLITSSCTYRLITVTAFALITYHFIFHSRLKTHLFHKSFPPQSFLFLQECGLPSRILTCTELKGQLALFVLVSGYVC